MTEGMSAKEIGALEWDLDQAVVPARSEAVPETPGENVGKLMQMMRTGQVG